MRSLFLWFLLSVASLVTGCASFYGSSILGHDSIDIPFEETTREKLSLGFSARVAALNSQFTLDSTRFWQVGPVLVWSGPRDDKTLVASLALTTYQAETTLHQPADRILQGRGWTLETKDGVIVPMDAVRILVAFDALVNQEAGDYRVYRSTLDGIRHQDLSPHGISAEAGVTAGVIVPLFTGVSVAGEWHNGFSCPDLVLLTSPLLGSSGTVRLRLFALSVAYTRGVMSVLNAGDSIHVNVQL